MKVTIESFTTALDASIAAPVPMQFTSGGAPGGGGAVNLQFGGTPGVVMEGAMYSGVGAIPPGVTTLCSFPATLIGGRLLWRLLSCSFMNTSATPYGGFASHLDGTAVFTLNYGAFSETVTYLAVQGLPPVICFSNISGPTVAGLCTIVLTVNNSLIWVKDTPPGGTTPATLNLGPTCLTVIER